MFFCFGWVALTLLFLAPAAARADIGVVLADPTTVGVSRWTHSGHSLVYLSGVCAETPVKARLCGPHESGSIITAYPDFRENRPYFWNIVPLSLYLEGTTRPDERLLYASVNVKHALEEHEREGMLQPVCTDGHCPQQPHSYWRDLVASTADRDIFIYAVHTTRAQDQAIVDRLNASANVNHYRSMTNNCSNFTERLINSVFPHSVHRDWLNDLGMMSPKGAARSFTRWAEKRPELGLYSLHFAQQPGSLPRSGIARSGTEDGFHMKKYLIPAALIGDHEVAGSFFVAYFLTGRFGLYKQYRQHGATLPQQNGLLHNAAFVWPAKVQSVVGTKQQWSAYRERLAALERDPQLSDLIPRGKHEFPAWFAKGEVALDASGMAWLVDGKADAAKRVGLSSGNVLAPGSDPELAFALLLGRVRYELKAKNHYRESMPVFRRDWALLLRARKRLTGSETSPLPVAVAAAP